MNLSRTFEASPPYMRIMAHIPKSSRPIEFSGSIEALAIGHGTYRVFPKPSR
jgi:hypothetical protein